MEDPTLTYEDMLFFERRLTEVISSMQPSVTKWRIILAVVFLSTVYNAYFWIFDPSISFITLWESLLKHPLFTISSAALLFLFLVCGVHKRVVAPKTVAVRCRSVLADFCLSCDEKPRFLYSPRLTHKIGVLAHFHAPTSRFTIIVASQQRFASVHKKSYIIWDSLAFNRRGKSPPVIIAKIVTTNFFITSTFFLFLFCAFTAAEQHVVTADSPTSDSNQRHFADRHENKSLFVERRTNSDKEEHDVLIYREQEVTRENRTIFLVNEGDNYNSANRTDPIAKFLSKASPHQPSDSRNSSGASSEAVIVTTTTAVYITTSQSKASSKPFLGSEEKSSAKDNDTADGLLIRKVAVKTHNFVRSPPEASTEGVSENATITSTTPFVNGTSKSEEMFVVDSKSMELLPLADIPKMTLLTFSIAFMVVGGAIPYVFQYIEIYKRKSALGFSLLVCLALCLANILRILFWFGVKFETPLLVQSIVMIICMILMLEISVRMNKKMIPSMQRTSVWKGDFIQAFWKWNDLSSYIVALILFTIVASVVCYIFKDNEIFIQALGMCALLVEACLGLPQLFRNFARRSVTGMSVKMVLMWLIGDVGKTIYFIVRLNPKQFYICGFLQITIDILILLQVFFYGRRSGSTRVPTFVPANSNVKL